MINKNKERHNIHVKYRGLEIIATFHDTIMFDNFESNGNEKISFENPF